MAEYWRCKKCGRVNLGYVGTCGCGGLKADGTQASEEDYKQEQGFKDIETKTIKKKWQCPNCLKINEGDFCSCGHVKGRGDKYVEESDNPSQVTYTTSRSGSNVKRIALIIAIIFGVIMVGKSVLPMNKGIEGTYVINNKINNKKYTSEAEIIGAAECDGYRIISAVSDFCDFMHYQNYDEYKYSIDVNMNNDDITVQIVFGEYHIIFGEIKFTKSGSSDNYRVYSGDECWKTVKSMASLKRGRM